MIGDFLIASLEATAPNALTSDLLVAVVNAIIDIYADETRSYDVNFSQSGYVKSLASQVNRVRNDVSLGPARKSTFCLDNDADPLKVRKIDRRKDRELRTRGEETYENLVAFIKYRRNLGQ